MLSPQEAVTTTTRDADLLDRAKTAQREAESFLKESEQQSTTTTISVGDTELKSRATSEADSAIRSSDSSWSLTNEDLTPTMALIVSETKASHQKWLGSCDRLLTTLRVAGNGLESEIQTLDRGFRNQLDRDRTAKLEREDQVFAATPAYTRNRQEFNAAQNRFELLRGYNNGQYARAISPIFYWPLIFAVGAGDTFINYPIFQSIFEVPIALLMTGFVAIVVAGASHVHGVYLKQHSLTFLLGDEGKKSASRVALIATFALLIVFGFVAWVRFSFFSRGGTLPDWFMVSRVAPSLFFNIVVWFIGCVLSYFLHERVPDLRETQSRVKVLDNAFKKLSAPVKARKLDIDREATEKNTANNQRIAECGRGLLRLNELITKIETEKINRTRQLSANVEVALRKYASIFCKRIADNPDATSFGLKSPKRGDISLNDFETGGFGINL